MASFKNITIVGGAGSLGGQIVKTILAEGDHFAITVITRTASGHQFPASIKVVELDSYNEESASLTDALAGQDVLIAAHNSAWAAGANSALLSCAIKAGVKRFVPSDYSADITHPLNVELAMIGSPLRHRAAMISSLFSAASRGEMTYTLFVPGGWMDQNLENGFLGFDIKQRTARIVDEGVNKATGCTKPFIAQVMLDMLRQPPRETENRKIQVAEVEYTGTELLAELEGETGAGWTVTQITSPDLLKMAEEAASRNDMVTLMRSLIHVQNFGGSGAVYFPRALSTEVGGSQYRRKTLKQIVKEAVRAVSAS